MAVSSGICSRNFAHETLGNLKFLFCFSGCEREDACGFATVTPSGAEVLCELYSVAEDNFNCTTSGLVKMFIFKNMCLSDYCRFDISRRHRRRKAGCYLTPWSFLFPMEVINSCRLVKKLHPKVPKTDF